MRLERRFNILLRAAHKEDDHVATECDHKTVVTSDREPFDTSSVLDEGDYALLCHHIEYNDLAVHRAHEDELLVIANLNPVQIV